MAASAAVIYTRVAQLPGVYKAGRAALRLSFGNEPQLSSASCHSSRRDLRQPALTLSKTPSFQRHTGECGQGVHSHNTYACLSFHLIMYIMEPWAVKQARRAPQVLLLRADGSILTQNLHKSLISHEYHASLDFEQATPCCLSAMPEGREHLNITDVTSARLHRYEVRSVARPELTVVVGAMLQLRNSQIFKPAGYRRASCRIVLVMLGVQTATGCPEKWPHTLNKPLASLWLPVDCQLSCLPNQQQ